MNGQWRCIEQLERDPAFLESASREFPMLAEALAATSAGTHGRRQVLRLFGAALAMGALSACTSGQPSGVLIPAVRIPPGLVPGQPNHYATAHLHAGYALGTVVTHQMDRPVKVEGNPNHPSSRGATDPFAQAELLSFYDPAREAQVTTRGQPSDRQHLQTAIADARARMAADKGAGFRLLTGTVTSPTLATQIDRLLETYPAARWHQWEPFNRDTAFKGAQLAYGTALDVVPHLDAADVILGIDSDLIESPPGWVRFAGDLASRRNPTRTPRMSRIYAIEPAPTLLGSIADHRFVAGPAALHEAAMAITAAILHGASAASSPPWVQPLIDDLKAAHGRAFIHAGPDQPAELHALIHASNEALGGRGSTYDLIAAVAHGAEAQSESLAALVADMQAGHVTTLLILDSNPVFTAPGALGFTQALQRVPLSIAISIESNETTQACTWSGPMTHAWESWADARGHDGTASILQPQALPLYGGIAPTEAVALFTDPFTPPAMDLVQATWKPSFGADFASGWRSALATGVVPNTASAKSDAKLRPDAAAATPPTPPSGMQIRFRPDPSLWDGRYASNPWLQELPRPLTKLVWDNPLLIPPALADRLKLRNGDLIDLSVNGWRLTVPVWMQPGQAADTLVAWCGNGRHVGGQQAGFDLYPLTGANPAATVTKAHGTYPLASTIHHNLLFPDATDIVKHATLQAFQARPTFAKAPETPELYHRHPPGPAQWAMSVDLNSCIGCNACVIACQAENNIPTVGKQQVEMEREMQWLRIDRYYEGSVEQPTTFFQPMLCMHCEKAPCELVCPVGATVHDSEG
ncbi:MAG TPA: TAT-variant-translocated molybdopterin oxidoreductase, partial [Acetobacteraceae bacterium]